MEAASPEPLTPREAMALLRVSRSWLSEAAKDGRLPAVRPGGAHGPLRVVRAQRRSFRTRREPERFLNAQLAAVDRGEVVASAITFAEYFDRWLAEHRPRIEEGAYRDDDIHGRLRLKPALGTLRLPRSPRATCAATSPSWRPEGGSERPDTVHRRRSSLSSIAAASVRTFGGDARRGERRDQDPVEKA